MYRVYLPDHLILYRLTQFGNQISVELQITSHHIHAAVHTRLS